LRASLWGVLMMLTLGLILPWRVAALERYKMRHSHYGDLQGSFEGRGWEFFKRGWWLWLLTPVAIAFFPIAPFVVAGYKAIEWRWWLSGIRFGEVRLESSLPKSALIGLYWKVIGWVALLGLVFIVYLTLCAMLVASMSGERLTEFFKTPESMQSIPLLVLLGIGYLVTVLAINVVMRIYLTRDLWVIVLGSVNIIGIEAAANVAARGDLANALGEGFADGLDVGGF
jgi:uncharacterized membrane protein YjgN (DUF898 family)